MTDLADMRPQSTTGSGSTHQISPHFARRMASRWPSGVTQRGVLSSSHSRTSSRLESLPALSNNCHHTASNRCAAAKESTLCTVHCLRRRQNRHVHRVRPQRLHCPLLLTSCSRSNLAAPMSNRTVCSWTTACSTGSSPLSQSTSSSSHSRRSRCRVCQTLLTVPSRAPLYALEGQSVRWQDHSPR